MPHNFETDVCKDCKIVPPVVIDENGIVTGLTTTHGIPASLTRLIIPSSINGVTIVGIADSAFKDNKVLQTVIIPDTVKTIGANAFDCCSKLNYLTIGKGVETIGNDAFSDTVMMKEINFNATAMNDLISSNYVFQYSGVDSTGLTVKIGANVTKIPALLFCPGYYSYAPNIKEVIFVGNSVCESIGYGAFAQLRSMTSINIPASVKTIGEEAFYQCHKLVITSVGSGVKDIGAGAFYQCQSITNLILPTELLSINSEVFNHCSGLISVVIPATVKTIDRYAFNGCSKLTTIYYCGSSDDWTGVTIGSNNSTLIAATRYYYSETMPTDTTENYWRYVDGVATPWEVA